MGARWVLRWVRPADRVLRAEINAAIAQARCFAPPHVPMPRSCAAVSSRDPVPTQRGPCVHAHPPRLGPINAWASGRLSLLVGAELGPERVVPVVGDLAHGLEQVLE